MNISTRTTLAGATALLAVLLTTAACGNESVVTDTGTESGLGGRPHAATGGDRESQTSGRMSADAAERKAAAEKARQDAASTARWDRSVQKDEQLKHTGHPGRP